MEAFMNLIQIIRNKIKLGKIRKELKELDNKFYSCVDSNWKNKKSSNSVVCFKSELFTDNDSYRVPFLKGIDLVIANNKDDKHIYLYGLPITTKELVKKYVRLNGFTDEFVKSDSNLSFSPLSQK